MTSIAITILTKSLSFIIAIITQHYQGYLDICDGILLWATGTHSGYSFDNNNQHTRVKCTIKQYSPVQLGWQLQDVSVHPASVQLHTTLDNHRIPTPCHVTPPIIHNIPQCIILLFPYIVYLYIYFSQTIVNSER